MHVLYIHQNYPAQFGHLAARLAERPGWRCTFVSQAPAGSAGNVQRIQYQTRGGATQQTHLCSRTFENAVWHCAGVYEALRAHPEIRPDLIVGHSGFGSTLFLRELYPHTPVVNLFEYYYRVHEPDSDMDYRRDLAWPIGADRYQRARCRNAMILLDLQNCDLGYAPTEFQKSRFPREYDPKLRVIFDGIDRQVFHGYDESLRPPMPQRRMRTIAGQAVDPQTRIVTYVSRGLESMRGFDIFMRASKLIAQRVGVKFIIVGEDRVAYGGDRDYIAPARSFKQWVLERDSYDLSRYHFAGRLSADELGRLLAASDLHIYLTVPFVLSWSMLDAMSCGAVVLGSATAPVREMIRDGENGLLADFFDVEQIAQKAVEVLSDPDAHRPLGRAAEAMVQQRYSVEAVLPQMVALYEQARARGRS